MGPGFESPKADHVYECCGILYKSTRPVGQVVKTEASHAFNIGSNPVRVTTLFEFVRFIKLFSALAVNRYIVGVDWHGGPPVPIPNTEVKLMFAENTCRVTGRENR